MPAKPLIRTSPFYDLVFHGLAYLPVDRRDASRLHERRYVKWADQGLGRGGLAVARTLPGDAERLARLYDAAPGAARLQGFALLHGDVAEFMDSVPHAFAEVPWPHAAARRRAAAFAAAVPLELLELFRIALWSEVRGGFLQWHRRVFLPQYQHRLAGLEADLRTLGKHVPGLDPGQVFASLPLCQHGRLLWPRPDAPHVVVGLAMKELDVPPWTPAFQAAHEHLLGVVTRVAAPPAEAPTPRPDLPGYAAFRAPEDVALCLGARLFAASPLARQHSDWFRRLLPNTAAEAAAALYAQYASAERLSPEQQTWLHAAAAALGVSL